MWYGGQTQIRTRKLQILLLTVTLDIIHRLRLKRQNVSKAEFVSFFRWNGEL